MKILLANKYFFIKGGAENSFFYTAKILEGHGHEVSFFSMQDPKNFPSDYSKYFISNVDYDKKGIKNKADVSLKLLYSFEARSKIEKLLHDVTPDIAHLNNIYHQISPSILHSLKKFKVPVVMSLRDYKIVCASYAMLKNNKNCEACSGGKYYQCFLKGCASGKVKSLLNTIEMYLHHKLLHIYDLVDVFISPSQFLKDKVEEMGFKGKVVCIPNCVSPEEFIPGYEAAERSVCYVGRISHEKGIATLVEAIKGLDVKLKIIGDGPIRKEIENKIRLENIHNVELLGYKSGDDLKNKIRRSMFLIVPSEWYENNPRSVIEAFALGKPVVGARIGGIPELVRDGETGITFEPGNAQDLREKIVSMLNHPDKIIAMGKNARKFVEQELNTERHYKQLMKIYQSVIHLHE